MKTVAVPTSLPTSPPAPAVHEQRWRSAGLILLLVLAAYSRAPFNGFIWDDDDYVSKNPVLRSLDGLPRIWFEMGATPQYYPFVFTSFWLEYRLWGLAPAGYHIVNILLHALNAILVWRLLRRLDVPGAWLIGAVFALHPVHVESVAWITERKNTLSALFYLLAARSYLAFRPEAEREGAGPSRWGYYALALVLFCAALLSKTVTCSFPAAMLLLTWWRRRRLGWRDVWPLLPYFVIGVALAAVTVYMERHEVGARGPDWELSAVQRVLVAGRIAWFYVGKLLWPAGLAFIYPRWSVNASAWWQYAFPAAALAVLAIFWFARRRLGRGPLVATLFFGGTLVPALGFIDVYPMRFSYVADHFQYLASLGILALVVAAAVAFQRRLGAGAERLGRAVAVIVLMVLAAATWHRTRAYESLETLWRDTLAKNPTSWMPNYNLGQCLEDQGRASEAVPFYEAALHAKPDHVRSLSNLGGICAHAGQLDRARDLLERAALIDPNDAAVQQNLGVTYARLNRPADAARHFDAALRLNPRLVEIRLNLAMALLSLERWSEAVDQLVGIVRLRPALAEQLATQSQAKVLDLLAGAYARAGAFERAAALAERARDLGILAGERGFVEQVERRLAQYRSREAP